MGTLARSKRLRKLLCGSCLIAAPSLLLVDGILQPTETTDPVRQYGILSSRRPSAGLWWLGGSPSRRAARATP